MARRDLWIIDTLGYGHPELVVHELGDSNQSFRLWRVLDDGSGVVVQRIQPGSIYWEDARRVRLSGLDASDRSLLKAWESLLADGTLDRTKVGESISAARKTKAPPLPTTWTHENSRIAAAMEGAVKLVDWDNVKRRSAHSLEDVQRVLGEALSEVDRAWSWVPKYLVVIFRAPDGVMGTALQPHTSASDRRLRLSTSLLAHYTIDSLKRTLLHELTHFKRFDEGQEPDGGDEGHDARFCELLSQVDARVVSSPRACRYFMDDLDAGRFAEAWGGDPLDIEVQSSTASPRSRWIRSRLVSLTDPKKRTPWFPMATKLYQMIASLQTGRLKQVSFVASPSTGYWSEFRNLRDAIAGGRREMRRTMDPNDPHDAETKKTVERWTEILRDDDEAQVRRLMKDIAR